MTDTVDIKRPFDIVILNRIEIRMGSPFNFCDIQLRGTKIQIPESGWQDKFAWSPDNKFLVLIQWNIDKKNDPGFNFYTIDADKETIHVSERINGIVTNIKANREEIIYKTLNNKMTEGLTEEFQHKLNS